MNAGQARKVIMEIWSALPVPAAPIPYSSYDLEEECVRIFENRPFDKVPLSSMPYFEGETPLYYFPRAGDDFYYLGSYLLYLLDEIEGSGESEWVFGGIPAIHAEHMLRQFVKSPRKKELDPATHVRLLEVHQYIRWMEKHAKCQSDHPDRALWEDIPEDGLGKS
ncbi:MAG: hypothetical protein EOP86_26575 [Verrucomicrobiaceae bacterium]|nr:MAG: hypothetical protein EOP86_26575 [Verrucomicrobiaceae bacterium]